MDLYPLKFNEIYKEKIWGGRGIEAVLGKSLPPDRPIGESWEISDHFDDTSVVRNGVHEGRTLRDLWSAAPEEFLGAAVARRHRRWFPLLVKYIDAAEVLSVQVHPDDAYADRCDPNGDGGKNEAWYILAARPGAEIVSGVSRGTTKEEFTRLLAAGRLAECLHSMTVERGHMVHMAAGTVHAVGDGILLCEIQQTSDATYRIWDWGRPGPQGAPRPLHLEQALDVIDFSRGPVDTIQPREVSGPPVSRWVLDESAFFVVEKVQAAERYAEPRPPDRFYILICIAGSGSMLCDGERYPYALGDTILLPAAAGHLTIEPSAETTFLKTFIP